jgi:adenylate cyclase
MTSPADGLAALAAIGARLVGADGLEAVVDAALDAVVDVLHHPHALLLLREPGTEGLVTYASRGYDTAGVGSEVLLGTGVIGTAAAGRKPMRIGNLQRMLAYLRTAQRRPAPWIPGAEEALPGLSMPRSQLAAPMVVRDTLVGVLAVESEQAMRYDETDERVLALTAQLVGALIAEELSDSARPEHADEHAPALVAAVEAVTPRPPARLRHYVVDGSTFLDDEYVIKGVAGRLLWKVASEHAATGRTAYTNREARLDPALEMPTFKDNFESRLVLLKRRLEERDFPIRILRPGRGRFEVEVRAALQLERIAACDP